MFVVSETTNSPVSAAISFEDKKAALIGKIIGEDATSKVVSETIASWKFRSTQCAAPIKKDHIYFKCVDCSNQPTHCICEACFFASDHQGHCYLYFNKLTVVFDPSALLHCSHYSTDSIQWLMFVCCCYLQGWHMRLR